MRHRLIIIILLAMGSGHIATGATPTATANTPPKHVNHADALLDLAFAGVSEMPLRPHIKNRARAQYQIVTTCLSLELADLAEQYIPEISNWQRWNSYADLAYFYAENGTTDKAEAALQQAEAALQTVADVLSGNVVATAPNPLLDTLRDWRYKKVLARTLETRWLLHTTKATHALESHNFDEATLASLQTKKLMSESAQYTTTLDALRPMTTHANFEVVHPALLAMIQLLDQQYSREEAMRMLEEDIVPSFTKKPVFMRVDVLEKLTRVLRKHGDLEDALQICDHMDTYIDGAALPANLHIAEKVKVLTLRHALGQPEAVSTELDQLHALFQENRERIVNIERAKPLCRLAEVQMLLGHEKEALTLYQQAIVEGQLNPNSRPRANDLSTICCSMALSRIAPTTVIYGKLEEMKNKLGTPW